MVSRRRYLGVAGVSFAGLAGCLGGIGGQSERSENTYLDEPDNPNNPDAVSFPVYGEALPSATMTGVLRGEQLSTTGFDTDVVMTFIYGNCRTVCPRLTSTLRNIQSHSVSEGYESEVSFLEVTFDPERDTAASLREHAEVMNVNLDADNWYILRPESPERAEEIVREQYGVFFEKTHPENMDMYMFNHLGLILLANGDGYVERTYPNNQPAWQQIRDDLVELRRRES